MKQAEVPEASNAAHMNIVNAESSRRSTRVGGRLVVDEDGQVLEANAQSGTGTPEDQATRQRWSAGTSKSSSAPISPRTASASSASASRRTARSTSAQWSAASGLTFCTNR